MNQTYRINAKGKATAIGLSVVFTAFFIASLFVTGSNALLAKIFMLVLWGAMALGSIAYWISTFNTFDITDEGITVKTLRDSKHYAWANATGYDQMDTAKGSYQFTFGADSIQIPFNTLDDGAALRDWLDKKIVPGIERSAQNAVLTSQFSSRWLLLILSLFLSGIFGAAGYLSVAQDPKQMPLVYFLGAFCALLVLLSIDGLMRKTIVDQTTLVRKGLFSNKTINLDDVKEIQLKWGQTKNSVFEYTLLQVGFDEIRLSDNSTNYPLLRDALLARCRHATIIDGRPVDARTRMPHEVLERDHQEPLS